MQPCSRLRSLPHVQLALACSQCQRSPSFHTISASSSSLKKYPSRCGFTGVYCQVFACLHACVVPCGMATLYTVISALPMPPPFAGVPDWNPRAMCEALLQLHIPEDSVGQCGGPLFFQHYCGAHPTTRLLQAAQRKTCHSTRVSKLPHTQ